MNKGDKAIELMDKVFHCFKLIPVLDAESLSKIMHQVVDEWGEFNKPKYDPIKETEKYYHSRMAKIEMDYWKKIEEIRKGETIELISWPEIVDPKPLRSISVITKKINEIIGVLNSRQGGYSPFLFS